VVDEVEQARIGPLKVLEHEHGRALFGDALEEQAPGREERVATARRSLLDAQEAEQLVAQLGGDRERREQRHEEHQGQDEQGQLPPQARAAFVALAGQVRDHEHRDPAGERQGEGEPGEESLEAHE